MWKKNGLFKIFRSRDSNCTGTKFFQKYDAFKDIYSTYIGYLIPMIYAVFISIFLEPLVSKIEQRFKLERWVAVAIVIVLVIIGVAGFVGLILPQLGKSFKELYNKLPHMQEQLEAS